MRARTWTSMWAAVAGVVLLGAGPARAASDDPLIYLPEVLVIIDSSCSMNWDSYPCGEGGAMTCNRIDSVREVLTGTFQSAPGNCGAQGDDGILDEYRELIRFGYASFDCNGAATYNYGSDAWGYGMKSRKGVNSCSAGDGCLIDLVDPAFPPDLYGDITDDAHNEEIQTEVCAMWASGGTPLCAALCDAKHYFENWHTEIAYDDPNTDCRPKFVLLMSDGQENTGCNGTMYGTGAQNALALWNAGITNPVEGLFPSKTSGIPTFVVGFGGGLEPWLDPIAQAGSGGAFNAFVADDPDELKAAFAAVLDAILSGTASRTDVASAPAVTASDTSYQYMGYFEIGVGSNWHGHLVRTPVLPDSDDDGFPEYDMANQIWFEDVLATQHWLSDRNIYTVVHDPRSQSFDHKDPAVYPRKVDTTDPSVGLYPIMPRGSDPETIPWMCLEGERDCIAWTDSGICNEYDNKGCTVVGGDNDGDGDEDCSIAGAESDELAFCFAPECGPSYSCIDSYCRRCEGWLDTMTCDGGWVIEQECIDGEVVQKCTAWGDPAGENDVANHIKEYLRGKPGAYNYMANWTLTGPWLGDIFHSSPVVVPPPAAMTPDYKYEIYYLDNQSRHTMVYVGANDGMLHAFIGEDNKDDGDDQTGEELWGFVPTNLLAKIKQLRSSHTEFVDATPVVRDVYFHDLPTPDPTTPDPDDCLESSPGVCETGTYRTVLISGERGGGPTYFALDVTKTEPDEIKYLWEYRTFVPRTLRGGAKTCMDFCGCDWGAGYLCNAGVCQKCGSVSCAGASCSPTAGSCTCTGDNWTADDYEMSAGTVSSDYAGTQCRQGPMQTWAMPIVGSVWLRNMDEASYTSRSVAVFPGGVVGNDSFRSVTSCVELMEMVLSGASMHVVDIETGKLLRKFFFSDTADTATLEAELQDYYDTLEAASPSWMSANPITYNGGADGNGWDCYEKRLNKYAPMTVPFELMGEENHVDTVCNEVVDVSPIAYRIECCNNPGGSCNPSGTTTCHYRYTRFESGRIETFIKTEGCPFAAPEGRFDLAISEDFWMDGVSATVIAYNTSLGKFIDRVFVPTKAGKIFRVNMNNAQYDPDADEGEMIVPYPEDPNKNWRLDPSDRPWFDPFEPTAGPLKDEPRRPISVTPGAALNYNRNLVLFVGTGDPYDMESNAHVDYFMAVEEGRNNPSGDYYDPKPDGNLFEKEGVGLANNPMFFPAGERLFSRPLVIAGRVAFTTYVAPGVGTCELGSGKIYAMPFDDFRPSEFIFEQDTDEIVGHVDIVWSPGGGVGLTAQGGDETHQVDLGEATKPAARILSWGRVF